MTTLSFHDLRLPPAQMKALQKKARTAGKTAAEYARLVLQRDLLADQSFDEILRPIREDFKKEAVTEETMDAIVRRARRAISKKRKPLP